ncbi:MAG: hypothetical protein AAFN30_06005 [Actinomycetota bacterium]
MSLYLADYIVLRDGPAYLDNGEEVASELSFPAGLVTNRNSSRPVLSFRAVGGAWSEGTVRVSIDDQGDIHKVIDAKVPPGETIEFKEVISNSHVNAEGDNSVRFRHIAGGKVSISDAVIWFQRRVDAEVG